MKKATDWVRPKRLLSEREKKRLDKLKKIVIHGKEEARLNLILPVEVHYDFKKKCFDNRTTMSRELLAMILNYIKQDQ